MGAKDPGQQKLVNILRFLFIYFYLKFDTILEFSTWLKTSSNKAFINPFRGHNRIEFSIKKNNQSEFLPL